MVKQCAVFSQSALIHGVITVNFLVENVFFLKIPLSKNATISILAPRKEL